MSLTLSFTQPSNPFLDHPYSRSNTIDTTSDGTTRNPSTSGVFACPLPTSKARLESNKENSGPRKYRSSINLRHTIKRSILNAHSNQTLSEQAPTRGPLPAEAHDSNESFCTIPLDDCIGPKDLFNSFSGLGEVEKKVSSSQLKLVQGSCESLPREHDLLELVPIPPSETRVELQPSPLSDPAPFRRWLSKLRKRVITDKPGDTWHHLRLGNAIGESAWIQEPATRPHQHQSDSHSSFDAFITGVKTATLTLAETSTAPRSWLDGRLGHLRSSRFSRSGQGSDETSRGQIILGGDEAAISRAIQRRRILEELIESEESYVGDLKVLTNVYFTLLASVCTLSTHAKALVRENLSCILDMHELLLGELYEAVPHSEYNQLKAREPPAFHPKGHVRWHSADSGVGKIKDFRRARKFRHSIDLARHPRNCPVGSVADPETASAVARVFARFMPKFFAYEQYGAKYEMMVRDMTSTYKSLSTNQTFEKGIEILSHTLDSIEIRDAHGRKGLTFADLLIKPIQRVCKYPLLFSDLVKCTPLVDGPQAHSELEKVLFWLREATGEINRATDDPSTRLLIEKTWLLQDRLIYPSQIPSSTAHILGHVLLCGALHVAYDQNNGAVRGEYMLCALFKSCLVVAVPRKRMQTFDVVASIPMAAIRIEEADSGKGLQCHTAAFSWKVVFETEQRLCEFLFSACSPEEENQWRRLLSERSRIEILDSSKIAAHTQHIFSSLAIDVKPIGTLFGQPHTLARHMSIHRAATVGPKSHIPHVIIKNTESLDEIKPGHSLSSHPLLRSKSMMGAGYSTVLAPKRSERVQLEAALADVWTRDLLPYPAMKQSDNRFNNVIRKLSKASLSGTFAKRSSSSHHLPKQDSRSITPRDFSGFPNQIKAPAGRSRGVSRTAGGDISALQPEVVNFHNTPGKFLPVDFELDPRLAKPRHKKMRIRMTHNGDEDLNENDRRDVPQLQRSVSSRMPTLRETPARSRCSTPSASPERRHRNETVKTVGEVELVVKRHEAPLKSPKFLVQRLRRFLT